MDQPSPLAAAYARSLLELANERGQTEPIGREVADLKQVLDDNPTFRQYLADPGIGHEERNATIDKVFGGQADPLLVNFLKVMSGKNRLRLLPEVCDAFDALLDEQLGKVEVDVTVAHKLGQAELDEVRRKVGKALGRDAVVRQSVDESILGGLILRVGDQLIDGSVRRQLESMRERLLSAK